VNEALANWGAVVPPTPKKKQMALGILICCNLHASFCENQLAGLLFEVEIQP
jgi:hypothetical protein